MGQFSWLDCRTEEQVVDDKKRNVYVLIPKDFGGGHILEECYDGYGRFGGQDIYDLVADWNKQMIPEIIRRIRKRTWVCNASERDIKNLENFYHGKDIDCDKRWLGIIMACYDKDNFALEYPIKITHTEWATYEDFGPSKSDPDQGWECDADDDEYYG